MPFAAPGPGFAEHIRLGVVTNEITAGSRLTSEISVRSRRRWVDGVLERTGRVERRRRLLPAGAVVYFALALC
jgi:hypothetical protein